LGLDIAAVQRERPDAIGVVLGGHGITAWGTSSDECEARSLEIIGRAQSYIDEHGRPDPFGSMVPGFAALPDDERLERAAALFPVLRGLVSSEHRQVGHYDASDVVLDFLARERHADLAALGTSCPDHFLRTKVRPLVLDVGPRAPLGEVVERLEALAAHYRSDYRTYYERYATSDSPPMRGADPAIVLVPGVGMF
ncbi:short chain dehydrogenase, partial [mine drainage metagenome]